jgi:hypothetical protein
VRVRELAVASSALETLSEWLDDLACLEVLRLGHATLEEGRVGNRYERKIEGCDGLTAPTGGVLGADGDVDAASGTVHRTDRVVVGRRKKKREEKKQNTAQSLACVPTTGTEFATVC